MYQQNNGAGAKWFFYLAMVLIALVFALGLLVSNSEWLQPKIADATADQMHLATDIERQKSEIELQTLKDQAEAEKARQNMALQAQEKASQQTAEQRQNFYSTLNTGLLALMIALSITVTVFGINASLAFYKMMTVRFQPVLIAQTTQPVPALQQTRRQPSSAATQARKREQKSRREQIMFKHTQPFWSKDDGKSPELIPGNYPWAN
jgi:hypothetical protein